MWLASHSPYIGERTRLDYQEYIDALNSFFKDMPLERIGIANIRAYHLERLLPPGVKKMAGRAGACRVRMESSTLRQIMREAGCWSAIQPLYKHPPLTRREKEGAGQSFTPEEAEIFVSVGLSMPRSKVCAHCSNVMFRTGLGVGELRLVRREDFDVSQRVITVFDGAKNNARMRTVPLNESAFKSMLWILDRWKELGGTHPGQYLLPFRGPDFTKPMTRYNVAWKSIIDECIKRELYPVGFHRRPYDCRVTAVTRSLTSGKVSIHAAQRLFGHVSQKMQKRYYKPDMDTLRDAVAVLDEAPRKPPQPELVKAEENPPKSLTAKA